MTQTISGAMGVLDSPQPVIEICEFDADQRRLDHGGVDGLPSGFELVPSERRRFRTRFVLAAVLLPIAGSVGECEMGGADLADGE